MAVQTKDKNSMLPIAAGAMFALGFLCRVLMGNLTRIPFLLLAVSYVLFAVVLFARQKNALILAPIALLFVSKFCIYGFVYGGLQVYYFLEFLCLVSFFIIALLNIQGKGKALWFLPGIFAALSAVNSLLNVLRIIPIILSNGDFPVLPRILVGNLVEPILYVAGILLAAKWFAGSGMEKKTPCSGAGAEESVPAYAPQSADGYCSMAVHVLLMLLTCGVYNLVWIYRVTKYLNCVEGNQPRNATNKLLLCMFVPFYSIYWTYQSAQRIDKLAKQKGRASDISTLCLVLAILLPIVPPILMQAKINEIVGGPDESASAPAYAPASTAAYTPASSANMNTGVADELKKYKELLDSGVISREEFDAKKKQLLGL